MIVERPVIDLLTFQVWDSSYLANAHPNPGMESGTTSGYMPNDVYGARGILSATTERRHSGKFAGKYTAANGSNEGIRFVLPAGQKTTSVWAFVPSTNGPNSLRFVVQNLDGAFIGGSYVTTLDAWVQLTVQLTPASAGATAFLYSDQDSVPGSVFYWDDVRITGTAVGGGWRDLADHATDITIVRGGELAGASSSMQVGTLDATLIGVTSLATDPALRPNSPIRVIRVADGQPEFTGTIADIDQDIDYDKTSNTKTVWTTIAAVDAVQSLANTDRSGAVADTGAGQQSFTERLNQLATSSLVPMSIPDSGDVEVYGLYDEALDGWTGQNASSSGNVSFSIAPTIGPALRARVTRTGAGAAVVAPRVYRQFRDLDPTSTYAFVATVALTESTLYTPGTFALTAYGDYGSIVAQSDPFTFTDLGTTLRIGVQFRAPGQVATLALTTVTAGAFAADAGAAVATIVMSTIRVVQVGDPNGYQLQDVVYEGSLLDHIDLACNSVAGRWWVDKSGTVQFARQLDDAGPVLTFGDTAAADVSYVDLKLRYDTRNVVNALRINQHGRNAATDDAADVTLTLDSGSSIRRWGIRSSSLDTCLYTGAGHEQDALRRGREVMAPMSRPRYIVSTFTINAQSDPSALAALELRARIQVDYEQLTQACRVLKLTHTISPYRWLVQVDVSDVRSAPSFAEFNAATPGTFADFNATHPGTFTDFTAAPIRETP